MIAKIERGEVQLGGPLELVEVELPAGDCLQLGPPAPCSFVNPRLRPCRYLVALARRGAG